MVRYVPAVHDTDSAIVRTLREAQHAHRESPRRSVDTYRPSSIGIGERSRETIDGARVVAVRADAMRHARTVLDSLAPGELAPGEHGPAPCSGPAILASLDDPATVNALRILATAGMRCVVSRSNARGEVATTYRPVDPFGREVSEAIGSLWLANATQSWRHGAPRTLAGIVTYLRTIVRRMSQPIGPRAKKGGPAAPLPLVSAADVVGAGGIEALLEAEHAYLLLSKAITRVACANARHGVEVDRFIDDAANLGVSEARRRIRSDATAKRAMRRLRIELAALGEDSGAD